VNSVISVVLIRNPGDEVTREASPCGIRDLSRRVNPDLNPVVTFSLALCLAFGLSRVDTPDDRPHVAEDVNLADTPQDKPYDTLSILHDVSPRDRPRDTSYDTSDVNPKDTS
jgi:hypothetical protein